MASASTSTPPPTLHAGTPAAVVAWANHLVRWLNRLQDTGGTLPGAAASPLRWYGRRVSFDDLASASTFRSVNLVPADMDGQRFPLFVLFVYAHVTERFRNAADDLEVAGKLIHADLSTLAFGDWVATPKACVDSSPGDTGAIAPVYAELTSGRLQLHSSLSPSSGSWASIEARVPATDAVSLYVQCNAGHTLDELTAGKMEIGLLVLETTF